jgi:hypothetical protein
MGALEGTSEGRTKGKGKGRLSSEPKKNNNKSKKRKQEKRRVYYSLLPAQAKHTKKSASLLRLLQISSIDCGSFIGLGGGCFN